MTNIVGNSGFMECDRVSLGEWFLTFQRIIASSSSVVKHSKLGSFRSQEPLTQHHSVISQETQILSNTAIRTSDLTQLGLCVCVEG